MNRMQFCQFSLPMSTSRQLLLRLLLFLLSTFGVVNLADCSAIKNSTTGNLVLVSKCCEKFEIFVDDECIITNDTKKAEWIPEFKGSTGNKVSVNYRFVVGKPACGNMRHYSIYHSDKNDRLILLETGKLQHFTAHPESEDFDPDVDGDINGKELFYEYEQKHYCLETETTTNNLYAMVCSPAKDIPMIDSDFVLRKIINPIFHGLSMIILLVIAIIYFVLPTLRDLVGNIVTTITLCLIVSQAADLVRIFTELTNHVNFFIADTILFVSLLAAFLWLTSFGYYIWKMFRSRNVFLRVTDGRKYCWYSAYTWGTTFIMAGLAVFAHFFLDSVPSKKANLVEGQEIIGWLGRAILFTPIAISVLVNICFYATTLRLINRRNVYGRIQQKLKSNFIMFALMFTILTVGWLFLIFSWLRYDGLLYTHIVVNALQAPLFFYICVVRQKHVTFLLKKACCYNEPSTSAGDWGDEMHYMNSSSRWKEEYN